MNPERSLLGLKVRGLLLLQSLLGSFNGRQTGLGFLKYVVMCVFLCMLVCVCVCAYAHMYISS